MTDHCARCGALSPMLWLFFPAAVVRVQRTIREAPVAYLCPRCHATAETVPAVWLSLEMGSAVAETRATALFGKESP